MNRAPAVDLVIGPQALSHQLPELIARTPSFEGRAPSPLISRRKPSSTP
ncbi:MAG: hypothetical protein WDN06_07570 [Asticcacaulis sp.]